MQNERNSLKAGIFIIVSMALIVAIVIGIKGVGRFLEPTQHATVSFTLTDDIGGLSPGDEVRIGGAKVGVVRSVEFTSDEAGQQEGILVGFTVPQRFHLRKDAVVSIQSTVTGVSVLNISSLGKAEPLAGAILVGKPSSLNALFEAAPEIGGLVRDIRSNTMPKVNTAIEKASGAIDKTTDAIATYKETGQTATDLLKHTRTKIDPIVERYFAVADTTKGAMQNISDLFGDTKTDFRTTVANLRDATGTVKQSLPGIMQKADTLMVKITSTVEGAGAALEDVKAIAANTRDASASARSILVSNRSKIDNMISSLKVTGDNLKAATAEVRRSPWRLLYKPAAGEMANLNLYDAARQFADGANDMNDAASALRDALKDPDAKQTDIEKLVEKLDTSFANFSSIEKQLWDQVK
jgi:ABC-type transporter Mla subunit MlaD